MFFFPANPILVLAAVIPAIILLIKVYQADRLEKEPTELLISLVFTGIFSTFIAMILERIGSRILNSFYSGSVIGYNAILYFIIVAVSEEGAKFFLLKKRTWYKPSFNCQFDGVVYSVFLSLGFALWENISYVFMYGLSAAMIRAVTAVPGHACFGVFMGVFYGLAKRYEKALNWNKRQLFLALSLILPILLHGTYDFLASMESTNLGWIFLPFIIALFIAAWRLVVNMSKKDRYI